MPACDNKKAIELTKHYQNISVRGNVYLKYTLSLVVTEEWIRIQNLTTERRMACSLMNDRMNGVALWKSKHANWNGESLAGAGNWDIRAFAV